MEGRTGSVFSGARLPPAFFNGMMTSFSISSVVDMTPGQGPLLQTCLDLRVPALAICLSDTHCSQHCLQKFVDPSHTLHRPEASKFPPKTANGKKRRTRRKKRNIDEPKGKKLKKKKGDDEEETSKKKKRKNSKSESASSQDDEEDKKKKKKKQRKKSSSSGDAESW